MSKKMTLVMFVLSLFVMVTAVVVTAHIMLTGCDRNLDSNPENKWICSISTVLPGNQTGELSWRYYAFRVQHSCTVLGSTAIDPSLNQEVVAVLLDNTDDCRELLTEKVENWTELGHMVVTGEDFRYPPTGERLMVQGESRAVRGLLGI